MPSSIDNAGFMGLSGNLARRIATFDWAATPLGSIDQWNSSLKHTVSLLLPAPYPVALLWGPEGIMLYNDAYAAFAGLRDERLLGSAVRDGWDEISEFISDILIKVLAGETLQYRDHPLTLNRTGTFEHVWLDLDFSPVMDDEGHPVGVYSVVSNITEERRARLSLIDSENRLRFLDELERSVSTKQDAADILAIVTRETARHLDVANCCYADMDVIQQEGCLGLTVRGNWHKFGSQPLLGHYNLNDFGESVVQQLFAGKMLIINDNRLELTPEIAANYQAIGSIATLGVPLMKDGHLAGLFTLHDDKPRTWGEYECNILREVAERSWAHIQRISAEGRLRESKEYNRQILDSATDYGIVATDLNGKITLWNAGAAAMLGWTEQEVLGQPIDIFFTPEDCQAGRPAIKRYEALEKGRAHDARWHLRKSGDLFWGLSEMSPLRVERPVDDKSIGGPDSPAKLGRAIGFVKLMRDRTQEHQAEQALLLSEGQLRRAEVAGGVGLFSVDIATSMVSGTEEFFRIFGLKPVSAMPHAAFMDIILPDAHPFITTFPMGADVNRPLDVEYRIIRPDNGEERVIARKADYEIDKKGNRTRMVGVVQDVTERQLTLRALEKSEAQFSALAQNMPTQVWTAQPDGQFDWANDRSYAYTGLASGELNGEGWKLIVHPEDLERIAKLWARSLETGCIFEAELRLRDAKNAYRWHLARGQPLADPRGSITSWVITNTEIEAQKQVEAAYATDRDRLWNISRDLMMVCDFNGIITAVNPSGERLLRWSEDEMLGEHIETFIHPDDLVRTAAEVKKLAAGTRTIAFENRYRDKDGEYRLLAWTAVPSEERIHAIGRDITDQRAVEDALRQSQKMEAVGQLTGGIAHDFNNLLQGITGSLDIMHNRLVQGRTHELERWLTGARSSAERAAALTHRLLAFSRRQPLDPKPVKANPLVASIEDLLRRTLGEHIQLEFVLSGGLWLTRCDPNLLESAILNLVINARDAMPQGGKLTVETCNAHLDSYYAARQRDLKPGQYICIAITDTGTGMDPDTVSRAFEPFFTTKPIGQGTGLGLSMIYGFARQSDGYARIYSEKGLGTTIKLYLPRHFGVEEIAEEIKVPNLAPSAKDGEVILVVEDEAVVRGLVVEILTEMGYKTLEAIDGPSGLSILQSDQHIDLLVTDIGLPGLNGRQVAESARLVRPDLKVLYMTGYAENAALSAGFLEPGMTMITKPFAVTMLAERIQEMMGN